MELKLLFFFILILPEGLTALTLDPSANPVALGTNVTINVRDAGNISSGAWLFGPSVLFMWFQSSSSIINGSGYSSGITFNRTSFSLTIPSVNMNSTGLYVLESITEIRGRGELELEVQEPVGNVSISVNKSNLLEFNESVAFTCSGRGTPMWISWQNGSSALTALDRINIGNAGQVLTINPVTRYDRGPFTCVVANNISRVESTQMSLSISYGPSNLILSTSPRGIAYVSGSVISLSCSADSTPTASFTWTYNNTTLNVAGPNLDITNTTPNKTGQYSCIAYNAVTLRYAAVTQNIRIIDAISEVTVIPQAGNPIENMSFSLDCNILGSMGSFRWMKNNVYLSASSGISVSNQSSVLTFSQLSVSHNGQYKCVASNDVSNMTSQTYNLTVNYGPRSTAISGPTVSTVGSSVTFNCSAASYPQSQFIWYFGGVKLAEGSGYVSGALSVSSSGQYTCQAINNITGRSLNTSVELSVFVPVSAVTVITNNQQSILNQSVTLTCSFVGNVSSIKWMKNGLRLYSNNRITFSIDNSTVMINQLNVSDSGQYQCAACNPVSNMTSMAYNLTVNYGPWNTTIFGPTVGAVGSNVTFNCSANSQPPCQYSWFFGGSKVADGPVYVIRSLTTSNRGQYICMAYNNITRSSSNASLELTIIIPISTVSVTTNNQQPVFNQSVTLTCSVVGNVSSIQWMKNGLLLFPNNRITFSIDNSTVTINQLNVSDGGQYQCDAHNPVSNMTSMSSNLMVNYGPWNTTIFGSTVGAVGSTVTFNCSANSQPPCQYSWFFGGSKVADGSVYEIRSLTTSNRGQHTCMAYNNITRSSSNASVELTVITLISAVTVNTGNQQPVLNTSFTLTCNVTGDVSSIQWLKDGMNIVLNNRITFSSGNSTMRFNPLTFDDMGLYQCAARNFVSNMTSMGYNLTVYYGPQNTEITGPSRAEVGSNVTFICSAVSLPESQYTWFFNGSQVASSSVYVIEAVALNNTGQYTCNASNSITGYSNIDTLNFTVYVGISSVRVRLNPSIPLDCNQLQLMCEVNGSYNNIRWLKNNETLQTSEIRVGISADNTTVTFPSLRTIDDGTYQCVATNVFRSYASQPYQLVTNYGPLNVQIIVKPSYMTTLTCKAESQPAAVFQWIIDHNSTVVTNQSSIQVPIQSILGYNYTCVARNPLTNVVVYTSHFISDADSAVNAHAGALFTVLLAVLLPVLNDWL